MSKTKEQLDVDFKNLIRLGEDLNNIDKVCCSDTRVTLLIDSLPVEINLEIKTIKPILQEKYYADKKEFMQNLDLLREENNNETI